MISPFYSKKYYTERARFLLDISEEKNSCVSEIAVKLAAPEYGWIDLELYVDGIKAIDIRMSDVFDPTVDIRNWLTDIISCRQTMTQTSIDQEGFEAILTFEEFGVDMNYRYAPGGIKPTAGLEMISKDYKETEAFNNRTQLGLFTVYDSGVDSMPIRAIVSTRQLVAAFYLSFLTYAATFTFNDHKKSFTFNWNSDEYEDIDDVDWSVGQWDFYNRFKSRELEWYLYSRYPWRKDIPDFSTPAPRIENYVIMWAEWSNALFWCGRCLGNPDRIYADGKWIDLSDINGLREWYEEFDNSEPCVEWEKNELEDWMRRGRQFAFEIRRRLPANIDLYYYWMPFIHKIDGMQEPMDLIPNFPIRDYNQL